MASQQPEKGDLIEFMRGQYSHWGVYIGDGEIIHLVTTAQSMGETLSNNPRKKPTSGNTLVNGVIEKTSLSTQGKFRVNNYLDCKKKPFSKEKIVQRAESKLGKREYDLLSYNCEHFATWCRYGTEHSKQIQDQATLLAWATAIGVSLGGASGGRLGGILGGLSGASGYSSMSKK